MSTTVSSGTGIGGAAIILAWISGVVIVKGFWLTTASILFFPYGIYVFLERLMEFYGMIGTL